MSNDQKINAVRNSISAARMSTYENAVIGTDTSALELYSWNAEVSGALLSSLHICEVVTRNAVSDALESLYGNRWPWSPSFERSLPNPRTGYNPQIDLRNARRNSRTPGKVIPELKFVFWQKMFTSRYDSRLWIPLLYRAFPNTNPSKTVANVRSEIYGSLEQIRNLRNRIAHHEPIFNRNLEDDFEKIITLIGLRCTLTADWLQEHEQATVIIARKP